MKDGKFYRVRLLEAALKGASPSKSRKLTARLAKSKGDWLDQ